MNLKKLNEKMEYIQNASISDGISSCGENSFLNSQRPLQEANYQNCFPAQKRNRSELLSLFGGKNRLVPGQKKQGGSSNETIAPPKPTFLTPRNSENVSNIKRPTNSFFSEAFDLSLDDEEDFSDTSFQSLYNPKSETTAMSHIPVPPRKPSRYNELEVFDVDVCHDEFVDPEIDKVLPDYNYGNTKINAFLEHETSRRNTLPWEGKVSQVTKDNIALIEDDFDQLDDMDFDDDDEDFEMFKKSSKTTRSLTGYNVEYNRQGFGNPSMNTSMNSNCTFGRKQEVSQVGVGRNDLVNRRSDPEFGNAVLDYDECDDRAALLHPSSGRSSQPEKRERPNNMSSTSKNFFPTRSSSIRSNQFTLPLITSVDKNSSEKNHKSSSVNDGVTIRSSVRPVR